MLRFVDRNATWPKLIALLVTAAAVWTLLSGYAADFTHSIGKPTLPDFALKTGDLYAYAQTYSQGAIRLYLSRIAPLDVIFPAALGLTVAIALKIGGAPRAAVMLPLTAVFVDYVENALIVAVLLTADAPVAGLGVAASLLTKAKFGLYGLALGALIVIAFRRVMSQKS